jgi:hypothetical protein
MFKQTTQHDNRVKKRIHQKDLRFFAQFLSSLSSNSSPMMFFIFFLAWDQFSSQLRDVWDERVLKPLNFHEKTVLKLQVRASSPNNCGPQFLSRSVFHLISSCRFDPSHSKPNFSCWHPCLHFITCKTTRNAVVSQTQHKNWINCTVFEIKP